MLGISWSEMATLGSINSFVRRFLITVMGRALAQYVSKPIRFCANQSFSLLALVIAHATEDIASLNFLPPLTSS